MCSHALCEEELMFKQEGYDFMAAAFEVYNEIGCGMAEETYQQSLEIELSLRKIPFALIGKGVFFLRLAKISADKCSS
jgi:hypothetical protein